MGVCSQLVQAGSATLLTYVCVSAFSQPGSALICSAACTGMRGTRKLSGGPAMRFGQHAGDGGGAGALQQRRPCPTPPPQPRACELGPLACDECQGDQPQQQRPGAHGLGKSRGAGGEGSSERSVASQAATQSDENGEHWGRQRIWPPSARCRCSPHAAAAQPAHITGLHPNLPAVVYPNRLHRSQAKN